MYTLGMFLGLTIITIIAAVYLKKSLVWLLGVVPAVLMAVNANSMSLVEWDSYYFAWWIGIALVIICVLMALQTRSLDQEEEEAEAPELTDDFDEYIKTAGAHREKMDQIAKATQTIRSRRRK